MNLVRPQLAGRLLVGSGCTSSYPSYTGSQVLQGITFSSLWIVERFLQFQGRTTVG